MLMMIFKTAMLCMMAGFFLRIGWWAAGALWRTFELAVEDAVKAGR